MSSNPEKISFGPEHQLDQDSLEKAGNQQREKIREQLEKGEKTHENAEEARHEALEQASKTVEHDTLNPETRQVSPAEKRNNGPITKAKREASFKATMSEVQSQMSAPSRAFSKVIHNKAVEKVSDITASTIARPNAILSGAICSFVLTLAIYLIAKNLGYPLSGFETIGAFALGWVIGILFDFVKVMVTGRK